MKKTIEQRCADLIRRLGTNHNGEVVATVHALRKILASAGQDLHQVADVVEHGSNGRLSEAEMRLIFDNGFTPVSTPDLKKVKAAAFKLSTTPATTFRWRNFVGSALSAYRNATVTSSRACLNSPVKKS